MIMVVIAPWTEPFLAYLTRQELPEDQNEARYIVRRSKAYKVHEGELYKKSTIRVLQRCISEEEGRKLLAEIHAGLGGHHAAARALVSKAFRTGFYWPTAWVDAQDLVQRCVGCQLFANQSHMPPTALQIIPITRPFAAWGIDMVGPLKGGTHKKKYLLVMVDKFTKWIEAKPVNIAESGPVIDFISGVVHRYGVPHSISTDNGTNFTANEVKLWCSNMGIKLD